MAFYGHNIWIIISYHFYGFYDCVRTLILILILILSECHKYL